MDLSTIKNLYVGSTPVQSAWLGGTKVWERKRPIDILQSIFDAMVLWYDPERQGATNENMTENPVLTDLSGNGHDATCYNFEWTENSGISSTSYPNAIVSDGVDDYAKVEGLPILTDYTVIAKRKRLDADLTNRGALASKMADDSNNGAFVFELIQADTGIKQVVSFGRFNTIQMVDTDISYMIKNSYNGTTINADNLPDTEYLNLFKVRNSTGGCAQAALYSFILFNRTLTEEEIEWVKTNLIEATYRNPEALLIDAWIFSGHTNEEAPTQITGEKGTALSCYNFAWNEEGSGFKDGFLCFDGVNDRLGAYTNLPSVKTVIIKYIQPKQTYSEWSAIASFVGDNSRGANVNYHENGFTAYGYNFRSGIVEFGMIYHNITEDEVYTDYINNYGRNGEPFTNESLGDMRNLYTISIGCVYNNTCFRQAKIAYAAIYSESLTDVECMVEIKRLNALWESRKQ